MDKPRILVWALPFVVSFLIVSGVLIYRGRSSKERDAHMAADKLLHYNAEGKSSREIAMWIYDNYDCKTCHTLGHSGVFGLTPRGQALAKDFEGCPGMMQAAMQTLPIPEVRWTEKQKRVRTNFVQFGCALCHKIEGSAVGLTEVGSRASALHMGCPEVMSIVNR